jgi:anti-anti-sigma regulatory factor
MLRIDVDTESEVVMMRVEGKLTGDGVNELRRVWTSVRCEFTVKPIVVDISSVRVVDCAARQLLCQMHGWGTTLKGGGLMIGPLISEITGPCGCDGDPQ